MDKWITMYHPSIPGGESTVTERAFEEVWQDLGWQLEPIAVPEGGSGDPEPQGEEAPQEDGEE